MKNGNFKLIGGLLAGMLIGGVTVVGANQAIQGIQNTDIKVSLNGQIQTFKDETTGEVQYPITYHDRTYLPLRNVAQLSGLKVDYDESTKTALLNNSNDFLISKIELSKCPIIEEKNEKYEDYTLISKRKVEFNYNNHSYSFTLGIAEGENDYFIKDNYTKKILINWQYDDKSKLEDYSILVYDFNRNDEDIQLVIDWDYRPGDGPASTLYNVSYSDFCELGLMPENIFFTTDGRMGHYIWWLEEEVVSEYFEIVNGEKVRLINIPDSEKEYTVNDLGIGIIQDAKGNYIDGWINPGEKIHILSVPDNGWLDYEIQRENGEIVIVGQKAGRT